MPRDSMFGRGFSETRKEAKRQEQRRGTLFRLFLTEDGEERDVRFLTEEPMTFYEHTVPNGKRYKNVICTGDEHCPYCNDGDDPSMKGAFLVWDATPYKDGKGKKHNGSIKLYVAGTKICTQLDRIHTKYGLTNREITIVRMGEGQSTTYSFERGEKSKLSEKEIKAMLKNLPDALSKLYDGTADSLYDILEKALGAEAAANAPKKSSKKSKRRDYDEDDYEDDDFDDDERDDDYDEEYEDGDDEEYDDDDFVDPEEDDDEYDEDDEDDDPPPRKKSSKKSSKSGGGKSAKALLNKRRTTSKGGKKR